MKETIVELPGITLWYHPDKRVVHHEVSKYPGAEVLETVLEKGLEVLKKHGARKWLSDDRRSGALPKSHHHWAQNVWGAAAAAAGWKFWAICPPGDLLGSANINRLIDTYSGFGVTVKSFAEPAAAMAWLMTCD